jgi:serine protease AprX
MRIKQMIVILALLAALAAGLPGARSLAATNATIDPRLLTALTNPLTTAEAVVTFNGAGAPTAAQTGLLRQIGITTGVTLQSLPMAGVLLTRAQLDALAARPEVRSIYLNRALSYDNAEATQYTGVDRVRTDATMIRDNGGLPVTGKGVTVLVNDSGVDGTHGDLQFGSHLVQNVEAAFNLNALEPTLLPVVYLENAPNTDATGGHGTHVAGIVGATGALSNGKYEGVAPGAALVGYGSGAALLLLDVLGGFDYAITHQAQYGIRVITNSWGDTSDVGTAVNPNDPIVQATKRAYDRGITVVFSAGNSGPGAGTISGNYKKAPWVITVAAGGARGAEQGKLADFSSRGIAGAGGSFVIDGETWTYQDQPTLTAPGIQIVSTRAISPVGGLGAPDDITLVDPAYIPFYTTLSGTSMAAPHVAGVVALMLDANPLLTPLQIKQIVAQTATPMPGYQAWEVGSGYVNAYAAVQRAFALR